MIWLFLERNHDITIMLSTLKIEYDIGEIRAAIIGAINGPQGTQGYCSIWHTLQMDGMQVKRKIVADILREIDPDGVNSRRACRLRRRTYQNQGPNSA